jgi:hypothetical protein
MAKAVSQSVFVLWARFWWQVETCGICGGKSGIETDFLQLFRLSIFSIIPPLLQAQMLVFILCVKISRAYPLFFDQLLPPQAET